MKRTIMIQKRILFYLFVLLVGLLFTISASQTEKKEKNAISLEQFQAENCLKGQCVKGNIHTYLAKQMQTAGNGRMDGSSQTYIAGIREYQFYTIPIQGNQYITLMISEKETLQALETENASAFNNVYFEGVVVKTPVDLNYKWYEGAEVPKGFDVNNIIANYTIKQKKFGEGRQLLYGGLGLIVSAVLLMLGDGKGIFQVYDEEKEEKNARI